MARERVRLRLTSTWMSGFIRIGEARHEGSKQSSGYQNKLRTRYTMIIIIVMQYNAIQTAAAAAAAVESKQGQRRCREIIKKQATEA